MSRANPHLQRAQCQVEREIEQYLSVIGGTMVAARWAGEDDPHPNDVFFAADKAPEGIACNIGKLAIGTNPDNPVTYRGAVTADQAREEIRVREDALEALGVNLLANIVPARRKEDVTVVEGLL